ncbi:MAG TPA: hypothetical protein VFW08_11020 [bacterium]|nr:hypothetical protein [bacterium]
MRRSVLAALSVLAVAAAAGAPAIHAAEVRTGIEAGTIVITGSGPPVLLWKASVHLDGRLTLGPAQFVFVLDPGVLTGPVSQTTTGLTEAYFQYRRSAFDLRVGVERVPLETARLTLPFSIERVDALGNRLGRLGARLQWYPDPSTRLRLALTEDAGRLLPGASLRRQFPSFEVEVHALSIDGAREAYGLGASGLVGDLVVYAEVWRLTAPGETRYAAGISGSIEDGIWTLEAGYAEARLLTEGVLPAGAPRHQLAGQIAYRLSDEVTATATSRLFFDPDALRGDVTFQVTRVTGNLEYSLSLSALLGPGAPIGVLTAGMAITF